jgi:hypothetical protein
MRPEALARTLFDRVRSCDPSVADLFADDATFDHGDTQVHGRAAIAAFYAELFATAAPQPEVTDVFVGPPHVVAVLRVQVPDGEVRVADLLEVEDGLIRSLRVCRPG